MIANKWRFALALLALLSAGGATAQDCQRATRNYEVSRGSMRPDQTMVNRAWQEMQAACGGGVAPSAPRAVADTGVFQVNVRRVDKDIYRTDTGYYIQTRFCLQLALGDDAILRYEPYSYDNTLIFQDRTTCEVQKVFK